MLDLVHRLYRDKKDYKFLLNKILLESVTAYWNWVNAYNKLLVANEAYNNSSQRLENVKRAVVFGAKPSIDTIETLVFKQNRELELNLAKLDYQQK